MAACRITAILILTVSDRSVEGCSGKLLVIPPAVEGESYGVQVKGNPPSLSLIRGNCSVNGKPLTQTSLPLSSGI